MTERQNPDHRLAFRANVALAILRGERAPTELARHFDAHPNPITTRKA